MTLRDRMRAAWLAFRSPPKPAPIRPPTPREALAFDARDRESWSIVHDAVEDGELECGACLAAPAVTAWDVTVHGHPYVTGACGGCAAGPRGSVESRVEENARAGELTLVGGLAS